jgi:6-aminohexanoate-oligomer endohydrolase
MSAVSIMSHDSVQLVPKTSFEGSKLTFDFPAFQIGVAEYDEGPTGCTVFHFPKGVTTAVDERGGSVGAAETNYGFHHAICFAGGSLFGLEAISGVRAELLAIHQYKIGWETIPLVGGAIIWDWQGRNNAIYPDKALGRAALKSVVSGSFPLGKRGAGRSASVGKWLPSPYEGESCGQGAAFFESGPTKVLVFSVVNALGAINNRMGEVVRGHYNPKTGERLRYDAYNSLDKLAQSGHQPSRGNTTLTLVVTNQKTQILRQLARQVHASMARAIQPFHTNLDGDILFAASTNEIENPKIDDFMLAHVASELAWDAVLHSF